MKTIIEITNKQELSNILHQVSIMGIESQVKHLAPCYILVNDQEPIKSVADSEKANHAKGFNNKGDYDLVSYSKGIELLKSMHEDMIMSEFKTELKSAKEKYPTFVTDIVHAVSIMSEESGESTQAALNLVYHGGNVNDLRKELIQTAAMCVRCIETIDNGFIAEERY
jgi:hypothetical protein